MLRYLIRRMLLALPTLLLISMLAFGLSKCAPGDPVEEANGEIVYKTQDPLLQSQIYADKAKDLGFDLPVFYFNLSTAAYPDTFWRIYPPERRERLGQWCVESGNWPAVQDCEYAISALVKTVESLSSATQGLPNLKNEVDQLVHAGRIENMTKALGRLQTIADTIGLEPGLRLSLDKARSNLKEKAARITDSSQKSKNWIPAIHWYGTNNQYHHWLKGFATGDLGKTRRQVPVWQELKPSLICTLTINGIAIFLGYLIAIPLGVEMSRKKGGWFDRWIKNILFFLHSMPVFWLGGLLILLVIRTPILHEALPSVYFSVEDGWRPGVSTFGQWWSANASKCLLPILILTLYVVAVLALQMRSGMIGVLGQDYIRTARAKGLNEDEVYWNHALRNALFPIITIFAGVLPAVFTGSLVLESMFNFPGVGTRTFEAYLLKDLSMLSAIMMIAAALTVLGSLLADLLYAWADPRVRFEKKKG